MWNTVPPWWAELILHHLLGLKNKLKSQGRYYSIRVIKVIAL